MKRLAFRGLKDYERRPYPIGLHLFSSRRVSHAGIVLKEPVYAPGSAEGEEPPEAANPNFAEMMSAITDFEKMV